jgi:hypothetical protein
MLQAIGENRRVIISFLVGLIKITGNLSKFRSKLQVTGFKAYYFRA